MSHFTVLVALPGKLGCDDLNAALTNALAPFDENLEVEAYEEDGETYYRNPKAKWDYWRVGGRWGGYFPAADGAVDVLATERGWDSPEDIPAGRVDGGRKRDLDLMGMRTEAAAKAGADWDAYQATVADTTEATPWRLYVERVDQSGNGGYTIEEARRDYHAQPRVAALSRSEKFRYWHDAHDVFESCDRDGYAARQAARAVPGYAVLDAVMDGVWMAPGEMGWFGMSSDDDGSYAEYAARANAYVDGLPDDTWLVVVDCHI